MSISVSTTREPLVTLSAAAEHLSVSDKTLRRRIAAREIPAYRIGPTGQIRVRLSELEEILIPMGSARNR